MRLGDPLFGYSHALSVEELSPRQVSYPMVYASTTSLDAATLAYGGSSITQAPTKANSPTIGGPCLTTFALPRAPRATDCHPPEAEISFKTKHNRCPWSRQGEVPIRNTGHLCGVTRFVSGATISIGGRVVPTSGLERSWLGLPRSRAAGPKAWRLPTARMSRRAWNFGSGPR
jgi:hypothetical protein